MSNHLRYEAWTLPGSSPFEKIVADLQPISATGRMPINPVGEGTVTIARDNPRIDDIVTVDSVTPGNDALTLIRAWRGTSLIHEWLLENTPDLLDDNSATRLSGRNIEAILDYEHVEPYDWDGTASFQTKFPDWVWGGRNILSNPGFESSRLVTEKYNVSHDGTGGTFTLTVMAQTTAAIAWNATALQVENALELLSTVTDALVSGTGTTTDPWQIEYVDPGIIDPDMTGDGALLTGVTDGLVIEQMRDGRLDPTPWTKSQQVARGTENIYGRYASNNGFEIVTSPVLSGTYALIVNGLTVTGPDETRYPGFQQVVKVKPGGTYQIKVPIYINGSVAGNPWRIVIRTRQEELIASTTWPSSVTSGAFAWDQATWIMTDVVIPDGVTEIIIRGAFVGAGNPDPVYVDDVEMNEGLAATTIGDMILQLLADAQTDHAPNRAALTFITPTFTTVLDSAGNPWDKSDLSLRIKRGQSYLRVMRAVERLGYQWRLVPTSPTSGVWNLDVYNPGGMGTDRTGSVSPAIIPGQGIIGGPVSKQPPVANVVMFEGAAGYTARAEDTASVAAIGRRTKYVADKQLEDAAGVTKAASELLSDYMDRRLSATFQIVEPDTEQWPAPLKDYGLGDTLNVALADGITKVPRTIDAVGYFDETELVWTMSTGDEQSAFAGKGSTGSIGIGGATSAQDVGQLGLAVNELLSEFRSIDDIEQATGDGLITGGGTGLIPTVLVAASNARQEVRNIADYICDGIDDLDTLIEATQRIADDYPSGRLVLSEGTFTHQTTGATWTIPSDVQVAGLGRGVSIIEYGSGISITIEVNGEARDFSVTEEIGG